jgi:hypothetical protein
MGWLKLTYHYVLYWAFGTLPEDHHANVAEVWYQLNRFEKCIKQCRKCLRYTDSDRIKAMMGYCYGVQSEWNLAAEAYRSMSDVWSNPAYALALAQ